MVMLMAEGCWTLAGQKKVGDGLKVPLYCGQSFYCSFSISVNKLSQEDKKVVKPRSEEPGCLPPDFNAPAPFLSVPLISSVCFQRQLLQLCRPPTTSLSEVLDSSKSSSVSTLWHCQCPAPARLVPPRPAWAKAHLFCLSAMSYTLSNSSSFLLSLYFDAHKVVFVCHPMANGYPQLKSMNKGRKKVTKQENDRDQQKQHLCASMRQSFNKSFAFIL